MFEYDSERGIPISTAPSRTIAAEDIEMGWHVSQKMMLVLDFGSVILFTVAPPGIFLQHVSFL